MMSQWARIAPFIPDMEMNSSHCRINNDFFFMNTHAIVVTTISPPTNSMRCLAKAAVDNHKRLICIGDKKGPDKYDLEGVDFLDLKQQLESGYQLALSLPTGHYSRKNIGYLYAIQTGATHISETDDDNAPLAAFWQHRDRMVEGRLFDQIGWHNPYRQFTDAAIWPRGLPLEVVREAAQASRHVKAGRAHCPVQQELANGDTDVDAVYRMTNGERVEFEDRDPLILREGAWAPFNSQSTHWWEEAFELLYLPSYCTFRMTDIWRSFVAQACLWPCGWRLAYRAPSMVQERNPHDLLRDFEAEVPGYLHNASIIDRFAELEMIQGPEGIRSNMKTCYEVLIELGLVDKTELTLLNHWLEGIDQARSAYFQ